MKYKEDDYIRTKDGIIDKVIIDYNGHCNSLNCNCKHVSCKYNYYDEDTIIKSSPNIIDLIEVGDYINGHKVLDFIYCGGGFTDRRKKSVRVDGEIWAFDDDEIKSIVTKEQFSQMAYKIGD